MSRSAVRCWTLVQGKRSQNKSKVKDIYSTRTQKILRLQFVKALTATKVHLQFREEYLYALVYTDHASKYACGLKNKNQAIDCLKHLIEV
jgi:hypothetical protein